MQDEDRSARIIDIVMPVLRDHGLELVDLEWRSRRPRSVLRVFVDKPGGVAIADCERVSREVGDLLDVAGVIEESYDLEISSPGLDRLLRSDREFRWAVGKPVRVWQAGGRETRGRLAEATAERLVLETREGRVELPRASVTKARLDADVPWARRG
ncbi:MAG TPA: ribosome maturation factor RimP [Calidithermus sp.]|nr:ribosome maturation factor RimP [Calidithermus sp.]